MSTKLPRTSPEHNKLVFFCGLKRFHNVSSNLLADIFLDSNYFNDLDLPRHAFRLNTHFVVERFSNMIYRPLFDCPFNMPQRSWDLIALFINNCLQNSLFTRSNQNYAPRITTAALILQYFC